MAKPDNGTIRFLFGPVLIFRGPQKDRWRLSALFGVDGETEPEDLRVDGVQLPVPPRHLTHWKTAHLWRFDFAVPRPADGGPVTYGFGEARTWRFHVPVDDDHLTLAYVSATGFAKPADRPWSGISADLDLRPRHLLLWGGGQVDGRGLWTSGPALAAWSRARGTRQRTQSFTPAMAEEAFGFHFDKHRALWSDPEIAPIVARIPSVLMWTGGDRLPGLEPTLANTPVARGAALASHRSFTQCELAARPESLPENLWSRHGLSLGFRIGTTGILAVDPHAEGGTAVELERILEAVAPSRHLLIMIDRPALFIARDTDKPDIEERRQIVAALLRHADRHQSRITLLAGSFASAARLANTPLSQLTAGSAPRVPGGLAGWLAHRRFRSTVSPLSGRDLDIQPFSNGRYRIGQPTWLDIQLDAGGPVHVHWHRPDGSEDTTMHG